MPRDLPLIQAFVPAASFENTGWLAWLQGTVPHRSMVLEMRWDYCYLGLDGTVLDPRIFRQAAEYARRYDPELMVLSSPDWRYPSGFYCGRDECFHLLAEMGRAGLLYAFGNKLFSRRVFALLEDQYGPVFLNQAFRRLSSVVALSHPWVDVPPAATVDDANFFDLVDHFTGEEEQPWM